MVHDKPLKALSIYASAKHELLISYQPYGNLISGIR